MNDELAAASTHEGAKQSASFQPFAVGTRSTRRPLRQVAYDCVTFLVIRDGSMILSVEDRQRSVALGNTALIAPNTAFGYAPEGTASVTTIALDTDYMVDQLFWQWTGVFVDRHFARQYAGELFPDATQTLHVGDDEAIRLVPLLGEMATLRASGSQAISFFRLQGLLSAVIGALAPQSGLRRSLCLSRHRFSGGRASVSVPGWRRFQPVHAEARAVEALLRSDISRGWRSR